MKKKRPTSFNIATYTNFLQTHSILLIVPTSNLNTAHEKKIVLKVFNKPAETTRRVFILVFIEFKFDTVGK